MEWEHKKRKQLIREGDQSAHPLKKPTFGNEALMDFWVSAGGISNLVTLSETKLLRHCLHAKSKHLLSGEFAFAEFRCSCTVLYLLGYLNLVAFFSCKVYCLNSNLLGLEMRRVVQRLLFLGLCVGSTLASYCGKTAVPYSFEVLPNGAPVLGCAQPSCVAAAQEPLIEDSEFLTDVTGLVKSISYMFFV